MTGPVAVAAVDLGASGGRVMTGRAGPGELVLHEAHRFANIPVTAGGTLHWDILRLYGEILAGLRAAAGEPGLASVGIDSWGVDYGLLDSAGALLGNPVHYRDARTARVAERVHAHLSRRQMYQVTGTAQLPLNTVYQLVAARDTPQFAAARTMLLIPDLIGYWLTGEAGAEVTNASTTGLLDVRAQAWATGLMSRIGIPPGLFPPLRQPGSRLGELRGDLLAGLRGDGGAAAPLPVISVGSHDTASAVAGVPADGPGFGYISCGTWSLAGVELAGPMLTEAGRAAGFTNEAGIDGTVRYLRNVMGLWLLQESVRTWAARGTAPDLAALLAEAAGQPPLRAVIDPDDPLFLPPGDMPARIAAACRRAGQAPPAGRAGVVRCILDSLALAHRRVILTVQELSGRHVDTVHIVGGGARNTLLCQLTADACGLPVVAGPAEAAALGNVLVQARALGAGPADLAGMRALIRATQPLRRFEPAGDTALWAAAARRLADHVSAAPGHPE